MYRKQLIVNEKPRSPVAEAYRVFRTNIQCSKVEGELKSILFTSSGQGEGKSVTSANIATALAQGGSKVVIMDCDFRRPVQHLIFGRVATGLTDLLAGKGNIDDYLQSTDIPNLKLLASGPIPPNPSELLNSKKMADVISSLRVRTDYLIIDTVPVLPVTDACVLASKVDGVILVLGAGFVRPEAAQKARDALKQVNGHILGTMINRIKGDDALVHYYSYCGFLDEKKKAAK